MAMNFRLLTLMLIFLLSIQLASASFITLETEISSLENSAAISITNKGDEPAYNLQPELLYPTSSKISLSQKIGINEEINFSLPIDPSSLVPGSYPLVLSISYTDANNYPFTAIATSIYSNKDKTDPGLVLLLNPVKLSGNGKLKLSIKNLDDFEKEVKVRIIVPKEITIEEENIIKLAGRSSRKISFDIKDFSARPESTYAIFAIAEFDYNGKHHTAIAASSIKIVKGINLPSNLLIFSLLILTGLFILLKLRRKDESKHSNPDI